jgi:simple sugar transport system ATP-binding protein
VLITHKVREALEIADDVTVLRRGRTVLTGRAADLTDDVIVAAMLGTGISRDDTRRAEAVPRGPVVLALNHASAIDANNVTRLRDASIDVHAGEIVGVAGVEGSGQHELLLLLAGRLTPSQGDVQLAPSIGFVPEDRLRDALIPEMTLVENSALRDAGSARGSMPWREYERSTASTMRDYDVRAGGIESPAGTLSGGNQQKFVLGRELAGSPAALVAENPTRGLDIRATADVLAALRNARAAGVAIVIYSSDLDELLSVADRVVVCFGGRVSEVESNAAAIARAMAGTS